jgi:hypothetical protein
MLKAVMAMNLYSKHKFVIVVLCLNKGNMTVVMNQEVSGLLVQEC